MMKVDQLRKERGGDVPAVVHADGSARLQTVTREHNPLFHGLIAQFHELTGIPMLLNTSFNEKELIVCTPQEAIDCFVRTHMDRLILGPFFISRAESVQRQNVSASNPGTGRSRPNGAVDK